MADIWRDYIKRLERVYRVSLDECHREGMTDDGHAVTTPMLCRDVDGFVHRMYLPTDDCDSVVFRYQAEMVSEKLHIPMSHWPALDYSE